MMSAILEDLNERHINGNVTYQPIREWATENGEMGIYAAVEGSPRITRESVLCLIQTDDEKRFFFMRPSSSLEGAIREMEVIAQFADAEQTYPAIQERSDA